MTDPRVVAYAKLIVEHSLNVQPGWQVLESHDGKVSVAIIAVVDKLQFDKLRMKYANYAALGVISPSVGELGCAL